MAVIIAYFVRNVKFCGIIGMVNDMKDFFLKYLDKIIAIAVIIVACIIVNVIIDKIIDKTIKKPKIKAATTLDLFLRNLLIQSFKNVVGFVSNFLHLFSFPAILARKYSSSRFCFPLLRDLKASLTAKTEK